MAKVKTKRNKKYNPNKCIRKELSVTFDVKEICTYLNSIGDRPLTPREHDQFYRGTFFPLLNAGRVADRQIWTVKFTTEILAAHSYNLVGTHEIDYTIKKPLAFKELFQGCDVHVVDSDGFKKRWRGIGRMFLDDIDEIADPDITTGNCICIATCQATIYPMLLNVVQEKIKI